MGIDRGLALSTRQAPPRVSPVVLRLPLRAREASGPATAISTAHRPHRGGGFGCAVQCAVYPPPPPCASTSQVRKVIVRPGPGA